MKFALAVDSRIGGRGNNEDRLAVTCSSECVLLVVADGMGGHIDGEVAARIATEVLVQQFRCQATPRLLQPGDFLRWALGEAHQAIIDHAIAHHLREIPSTTVVVAIVQDDTVYCAYAGDSRLYLLEQGAVRFRSRDHSNVRRLIDSSQLTEAEAAVHPARNRIYNCLGAMGEPEVSVLHPLPLQAGCSVLLCSDGLWSVVPDPELARVFNGRVAPAVLPALMTVAEKRGGERGDNLSAVAFTLLPADAALDGRSGFIDSGTLTGFLPDDAIPGLLMEHELAAELLPRQPH